MKEEHLQDITLINGDCMDYMRTLPDKAFDLAIVDPPYGINAGKMTMGSGKHKFKNNKNWDNKIPTQEYFNELFRVSKNQIIWGGNYFQLPLNNNWVSWDKLNPNLSFSEFELAWCSINKNTRIFKRLSTLPDADGIKTHPTQKPIDLYKWILRNYAKDGDTILDTHLGSGSSAIAAHDGHFKFVGIELDSDYYEAAKKRIKAHQQQQNLF
jgi:site-specific DNA-methyltransferase (adenine-specific)